MANTTNNTTNTKKYKVVVKRTTDNRWLEQEDINQMFEVLEPQSFELTQVHGKKYSGYAMIEMNLVKNREEFLNKLRNQIVVFLDMDTPEVDLYFWVEENLEICIL